MAGGPARINGMPAEQWRSAAQNSKSPQPSPLAGPPSKPSTAKPRRVGALFSGWDTPGWTGHDVFERHDYTAPSTSDLSSGGGGDFGGGGASGDY